MVDGMVTKIYAHRGASRDYPEHTLQAYLGAIEQGADGFECDVRLTKDGIAVLWHDADMKRATKYLGLVAGMTFKEVQSKYPNVMLLSDLIELAIENKKDLAIETKHPVPSGHDIEREIAKQFISRRSAIVESGIEISVISFSWLAIEYFSQLHLPLNLVMLLNLKTGKLASRFTSANSLGPNVKEYKKNPNFYREAQKNGKRIFVWTVDDQSDLAFCAQNGVDVVITNKPGRASKTLGYP